MQASNPQLSAATASEIRAIVGTVDDDVIAKIVGVGATGAEVLDAYTWFNNDQRLQRRIEHELHGRAARVFEILEEDLPDLDDGRS